MYRPSSSLLSSCADGAPLEVADLVASVKLKVCRRFLSMRVTRPPTAISGGGALLLCDGTAAAGGGGSVGAPAGTPAVVRAAEFMSAVVRLVEERGGIFVLGIAAEADDGGLCDGWHE